MTAASSMTPSLPAITWSDTAPATGQWLATVGATRTPVAVGVASVPIVEQRLLQAGIRLAGVLNELFGE